MKKLLLSLLLITTYSSLYSQGTVYLVLGSDTAIWESMNTNRYNCTYNISLFADATRNAAKVMDPQFRSRFTDSFGTPVKITWWMMAGNIFRFATNNNVPVANTMTLWLMKKYYQNRVSQFGDELSLHYHTFGWTDYDMDGVFWWNQTKTFMECKDDFDLTLAQFLIEEDTFPVSFRSGWHAMDNDWQNYLDRLLPYSLHNDYPAKRSDLTEPLDNIYDWSLASAEFVPFHPSSDNYQLAGDLKGWNVRSKSMGGISQSLLNTTFQKANEGTDQLACIWSHLPDSEFPQQIQRVDSLVHKAALLYPDVKFRYCTAVEAYQLWRKGNDTISPEISFTAIPMGDRTRFSVTSSEAIFQAQPFVAVKDVYGRYFVADCVATGINSWETSESFLTSELGKAAVALTDTMGNQSISSIRFLPDDRFFDNHDYEYAEVSGSWSSSSSAAWGTDSRVASLNPGDSARVRWNFYPERTGWHSAFIQFPDVPNQLDSLRIRVYKNGFAVNVLDYANNGERKKWSHVASGEFESGSVYTFEVTGKNGSASVKMMCADVMKFSAFVRDRQLLCDVSVLDMEEHSVEDTLFVRIPIANGGVNDLTILSAGAVGLSSLGSYPFMVRGMGSADLSLIFVPTGLGRFTDTVVITSDDPVAPLLKIPFSVTVVPYFEVVDNEDSTGYSEVGAWSKSVAQAYGNSSRYANLSGSGVVPVAKFETTLDKAGVYDVYFIVPTTVNAADRALYKVKSGGVLLDSLIIDQNEGSGVWRRVGRYSFNGSVSLEVIDSRTGTSGRVLRADAVKWAIADPSGVEGDVDLPESFVLYQNYPNPFNPGTVIRFELPVSGFVSGVVYDVLGSRVAVLVNESMSAGRHVVGFDGTGLPSGVYLFRLEAGGFSKVVKMVLSK